MNSDLTHMSEDEIIEYAEYLKSKRLEQSYIDRFRKADGKLSYSWVENGKVHKISNILVTDYTLATIESMIRTRVRDKESIIFY